MDELFHYTVSTWNQLAIGDRLEYADRSTFEKQTSEIGVWSATQRWTVPYFDAMKTLRHMGVPSPLLDWTHSPFVAAYFAFCDAREIDGPVAVYFFQEATGQMHRYNYNGTALKSLGPFGRMHERHTRQQGDYTLCVKNAKPDQDSFGICSHEDYFANVRTDGQDFGRLIKYTIPAVEKRTAMRDLERMNITEASLFESQDAAARTLFRRAIQLQDDQ